MGIDFGAIRANYPLADTIARYLPELKKVGTEYVVLCPFHADKSPSLTVYRCRDGDYRYRCFACGAGSEGGDVIDFVAAIESVDKAEAVRRLTGGEMPAIGTFTPAPTPPDESEIWDCLLPVPDDAPEYEPARTYNPKRGKLVRYSPTRQDPVRGASGELLGYVLRLEFEDGKKICPVVTYCEGQNGVRRWCAKRFPRPTPLIGVQAVAARPTATVLVVSGEKCQSMAAAEPAFKSFAVVTWIGGDNGIEHADLSALKGRHLTLWPDADASGIQAMRRCAELAGGNPDGLRAVDTAGLDKGYDVADLIASGVTGQALLDWCKKRVKNGLPKPAAAPKPVAVATKSPPAEGSPVAGRGAQEPGRTAPVKATATAGRVSSPASNVVALHKPEPEIDRGIPARWSHDALADTFSKKYARSLLYVELWKSWMGWDGSRWVQDSSLSAANLARGVARAAAQEAITDAEMTPKRRETVAGILGTVGTITAINTLAKSDPRHAAAPDQFDADLWSLNTPGGVVNLRTGQLRPAVCGDYVTKITSATPGGECPRWLDFLRVVAGDKPGLIDFMQRMAGYCLTGATTEHAIFFLWGEGGNGKSVFTETLSRIMNMYAQAASMELFVKQKFNSDTSSVASLRGARLVTIQEVEEGKTWNEQRLTEFTGGTPISACFKYANPFTFLPQLKLVFSANAKPALRTINDAMRRRLHMIPFTVKVPKEIKDLDLIDKLQAEAGGILQWMIEGCLIWQRDGLCPPPCVLATTDDYFMGEDTLRQFIDETCDYGASYQVNSAALYVRYTRWSEQAGEHYVMPRKGFVARLESKGLLRKRGSNGDRFISGIRLQDDTGPAPWQLEN